MHLASHVRQNPSILRHRPRKLRPVYPSTANEMWYKSQLLRITRQLRLSAKRHLLPAVKSDGRVVSDSLTANEASAFNAMAKDFGGIEGVARKLAALAVKKNLQAVDDRLIANVKQTIGLDIGGVLADDTALKLAIEEAVEANVALITSIPPTFFEKLQQSLLDNLVDGVRFESMSDYISHVSDVTDSRAKLIARDQTSKMNGNFNQARQTSIGIEGYEWQTSGDERVRESHADHDGEVFSWYSPPEDTGHPGEDIQCRCVAVPHFDLDAMEAELDTEDPDQENTDEA